MSRCWSGRLLVDDVGAEPELELSIEVSPGSRYFAENCRRSRPARRDRCSERILRHIAQIVEIDRAPRPPKEAGLVRNSVQPRCQCRRTAVKLISGSRMVLVGIRHGFKRMTPRKLGRAQHQFGPNKSRATFQGQLHPGQHKRGGRRMRRAQFRPIDESVQPIVSGGIHRTAFVLDPLQETRQQAKIVLSPAKHHPFARAKEANEIGIMMLLQFPPLEILPLGVRRPRFPSRKRGQFARFSPAKAQPAGDRGARPGSPRVRRWKARAFPNTTRSGGGHP